MKKTALTILLAAAAVIGAQAQGAYDAWLFSENNYEGTARSVAMGNAFTALGGDLGAVTINPAGSIVAGYSQFTITPSLTFSTNTAYGIGENSGPANYFQEKIESRMTQVGMPNVGLSFRFDTGRTNGLKAFSIGFIANRTNSWCEDAYARGTNSQTSFLAAMAYDATTEIADKNLYKDPSEADFTNADYLTENAYKYMNMKNTVGYRSGMISAYDSEGKKFAGATETILDNGDLMQEGTVSQIYGKSVSGSKYEYLFNIGANISDFIYLGFNLGINSLTYDYTHYFKEGAVDPFQITFTDENGQSYTTHFKNATYRHSSSAEGTGVFGKLGIIINPGGGFRFGAAIQTPSAITIKEEWQDTGSTEYEDKSFNGEAESDLGISEYSFQSPWRANFGIAYTLGKFAALSMDYELAGFGNMKYSIDRHSMADADIEYFETVNDDIAQAYGTAHYLRLGLEMKPVSSFAIRAGYNLSTAAQKKYYDITTDKYVNLKPVYGQNLSCGIGFNSKKSFFGDLACRYTLPTDEYIDVYSDYLWESDGPLPPRILNRHSNWKVLLTIGWRF